VLPPRSGDRVGASNRPPLRKLRGRDLAGGLGGARLVNVTGSSRSPLAAIVIGGGAYGIVSPTARNNSGTSTTATSPSATSGRFAQGSGGSPARSGP
jgi:hypothetical protein